MSAKDVVRTAFKLSQPVKNMEGNEVSELSLRKPKTKDLRVFDQVEGGVGGTLALVAKLAGEPVSVIDELELEDTAAMMEWVEGFLPQRLVGKA